jgi:hypothetical protein
VDGTTATAFILTCVFLPAILSHFAMSCGQQERVVYVDRPVIKHVDAQQKTQTTVRPKTPFYNPPVKKAAVPPKVENKVKVDAVEALMALGMKKTLAKQKVDTMFEKQNFDSLESFLMEVYKK